MTYKMMECEADDDKACQSFCRDYSDTHGLLTSPYYPIPYPNGIECIYTITQQEGTYITLAVIKFRVQESDFFDETCSDYLEIRDGSSEKSALIGKFCGTDIPDSLHSTQNNMWIR